jgi:type VI secretion system secreted protein VgrG
LKSFTDATQNNVSGSSSGGNTAGGGTGSANAFKEPVMLFASPSGIALSTQKSIHIASDAQTNFVSGQSTHIATGKSLIASVTEKLSLFVQNAGMKLFAAKGKIEIQAQSDNIELTAQKTDEAAVCNRKDRGGGEAGNPSDFRRRVYPHQRTATSRFMRPGKIDIKGSQHSFNGPTAQGYALPALPSSDGGARYHEQFRLLDDDEVTPLAHHRYVIESESGKTWSGFSDVEGLTEHVYTDQPESLALTIHYQGDNDDSET